MKKVYVTGGSGGLGKAVVPVLSSSYEVRATDLPDVDVRDAAAVMADITRYEPDIVLHLASMTDVDKCELFPEEASLSNRTGTRNVALACREIGAVMAYVSTGMIYNGCKRHPYIEYDRPDPISVYGRTKYEGELEIRSICERFYIFNTCWLFGGGKEDRKFVAKIIDLAEKGGEIRIVDDKFGSPTYTADLARCIATLIGQPETGRYHCVNAGQASRYELAKEIVRIAGIDGCRIIPVSSDNFDLPAPRPRMEAMADYNLRLLGLNIMRDWREALGEYITTTLI